MKSLLSQTEGLSLFILFGVILISLVWFKTHREHHTEGFLVADRNVSLLGGALSIAATWMWGSDILIVATQAFTNGLPGIFWFIFPNMLTLIIFGFLAIRIRNLMPNGYTLPEFFWYRFGQSKLAHTAFMIIGFSFQLFAIIINTVVGGMLISMISGIDISTAMLLMICIALSYSLLSGLKASIFTDIIQMVMILSLAFIVAPLVVSNAGGFSTVLDGIGSITGDHKSLFDAKVAWLLGIPMTIALLSGPFSDQSLYQRTMSVKKKNISKMFIGGALLFVLIPLLLSVLGFVGVSLAKTGAITVSDPENVGLIVMGAMLPKYAIYLFSLMVFAGLCSTIDSAFCSISSMGSVDVYRRYFNEKPTDKKMLYISRLFMISAAIISIIIAFLEPKLMWIFFASGALVAAGLFPIILSLFWTRVPAKGVFTSILLSISIGMPLTVYAHINNLENLTVMAPLCSILSSLFICVLSGLIVPNKDFKFADMKKLEKKKVFIKE